METITRKVRARGIRPVMFDRYAGDNDTQLPVEQKMYYDKCGHVVIPSQNILGMLASNFYKCATKIKYGKAASAKTDAVQGFLDIDPVLVPFRREPEGEPLLFAGWGDDFYVDESVARIKKSSNQIIPNPKTRPVLDCSDERPWYLEFAVSIFPNDVVAEKDIRDLFDIGGLHVGIGTWRGRYGKFVIDAWE